MREYLHEGATARRSGTATERAVVGENEGEIGLAPPSMTISFLHMGFASSRNPDSWQVFQGEKCKKKSIPAEKCKNASFSGRKALQRILSARSQKCVVIR
jgi:hypothetical protein